MPGGVEAIEQLVGERVLRAGRVRADRFELVDDLVLVGGGERVAVALGVHRQPGAGEPQRVPVQQQLTALATQLAQPDLALDDGRARGHREVVERGVSRCPEVGLAHREVRRDAQPLAGGERHRVEGDGQAGRPAREAARDCDRRGRPGRARVAQLGGQRDAGGAAREHSLDVDEPQLGVVDRRRGDRPGDPAPVEPRAVIALALLALGQAPVRAHHDRMEAGAERRRADERLVRAVVGARHLAVDPHGRAVMDRAEAHDVATRRAHGERRAPPADAAAVGALTGAARQRRRVRDVRHAHGRHRRRLADPALAQADVVRVGDVGPRAELGDRLVGCGGRRGRGRGRLCGGRRGRREGAEKDGGERRRSCALPHHAGGASAHSRLPAVGCSAGVVSNEPIGAGGLAVVSVCAARSATMTRRPPGPPPAATPASVV